MSNSVRISLTEKQKNSLMEDLGSAMTRMGDDGMSNEEIDKTETNIIYEKLVRAMNKQTGNYYLWQLKDRDGPITEQNILEKWGGMAIE